MNKVFGKEEDFSLVRKDEVSRIAVSYEPSEVDENGNRTWYEVYFYRNKISMPNIEQLKRAIWDDINQQTDEKILSDFVWKDMPIWLSTENQFNYKAAFDLAMMTEGSNLPVTFKFGTDDSPIYYEFTEILDLQNFYISAMSYINTCLSEGWSRKDNIDWEKYEKALEDNL